MYRGFSIISLMLIPYFIKVRTDASLFAISQFIKFASEKIKPKDLVLDAGAGDRFYEKYFSHARYESTDKNPSPKHDFICDIKSMPRPDSYYDAVINTEVLEHVEYPQKVINEFYRILKPGGQLFLTAPQGWGIHEAPYHFFNFTKYGLKLLFKNAGFKIIFIEPMGGIFWLLAKRIRILPSYIFYQYLVKKKEDTDSIEYFYQYRLRKKEGSIKFKPSVITLISFPFYLIALPICKLLIPLLFSYLDRLDKDKNYTLGYKCYCIKT